LNIRCEEEDVEMSEEAMELLTKIGMESSLRYAINLISTSTLVATKRGSNTVETEDVRRVYSLFCDLQRSTRYLMEYQNEFMFHENDKEEVDMTDIPLENM
jgi:RuvB-like protein 2